MPASLLKDLLEHFSALPPGNKEATSDIISDAYEYLSKQFAEFKTSLARMRQAEDNLRHIMYNGGWLEN